MLACTDEEFNKMVRDMIRKRHKFQSATAKDNTTHPQSLITGNILHPWHIRKIDVSVEKQNAAEFLRSKAT